MEAIQELIRKYGLQEDQEHVIIPIPAEYGRINRCFLLKRRFLRIVFRDGHCHDYPLEEIIEASVLYPHMLLSESILLVHRDPELYPDADETEKNEIRGEGEKENTD